MAERRSHYELAFESYLNRRGTAYVAVEDVRHFGQKDTGLKVFDYIVYPPTGKPCLVDVKGRKTVGPAMLKECRQKNWVTQSDIDGLRGWGEVFGEDFEPAFVFAYWLATKDALATGRPEGEKWAIDSFAGRYYSFWIAPLADYAAAATPLSEKWRTVAVPRETFRSISRPLEQRWPAAACSTR